MALQDIHREGIVAEQVAGQRCAHASLPYALIFFSPL
jgi:hypothetical protein